MRSGNFYLKLAAVLSVAILAVSLGGYARGANRPLSSDDVTLLLIGGASSQKMITLIQTRGIDFRLNPDLVKQFYQDGASDQVIDALRRASQKVKAQANSSADAQPVASSAVQPSSPPGQPGPVLPAAQPAEMPMTAPRGAAGGVAAPAAKAAAPPAANIPAVQPQPEPKPAAATEASAAPLPDPSPARIQQIIQTFAAKEKLFKLARDNYTYHQINKAETLDSDGQVTGVWEQDWDILFDNNGNRIEKVTYAPASTLKDLLVTEQDIQGFRSLQPFVLTTDELPEYDIQYLGHVHVDYITAYVFRVRPKEIKKNKEYFDGVIWVDDHDMQIVKAEGRMVPQTKDNRFPRFTTWRQQIDGKYWFPTFTMADDTLYFPNAPAVHIKEIVKYTDYKQFKSKVRIISSTPINQPLPPKH